MKSLLSAMLIIMGLSVIVNAGPHKTLRELIEDARANGELNKPRKEDINLAGVPETASARALEVLPPSAVDGGTHDFAVFFVAERPDTVLFAVIKNQQHETRFLNFACDVTGKLRKIYLLVGENDASGKPIAGSGKVTVLDTKDRKLRAALQHELDFWLKGKYRKAPAKAPRAG